MTEFTIRCGTIGYQKNRLQHTHTQNDKQNPLEYRPLQRRDPGHSKKIWGDQLHIGSGMENYA